MAAAVEMLEHAQYWQEREDHCLIGGVAVRQRAVAGGRLLLRTLPNNGKVRIEGREVQVTASLGEKSHQVDPEAAREAALHLQHQERARLPELCDTALADCEELLVKKLRQCKIPFDFAALLSDPRRKWPG